MVTILRELAFDAGSPSISNVISCPVFFSSSTIVFPSCLVYRPLKHMLLETNIEANEHS
jgi:hypothetical protein